jgi:hypothetical protein
MNNEINAREVLNDSTIQKEKKWSYLVFFLMGIISFPIGYILTFSVRSMINLEEIWQLLLFPLLIFSVLFAIGLAAFKKQLQAYYSLKALVASFVGMFFILVLVFWPNSFLSLLVFFGPQQDASTAASISVESSAENITIYVPVLLDENKNALKMYENPMITGSATTSLIDTEHGKALRISKSGLGNYVFNWNEVPGKDADRFVKWLENVGYTQPGEKLDITKTDNDTIITVLGSTTPSGRNNLIIRLNEENILKFYNIYDSLTDGMVELGNNLFNWNEVPGKDTERFVSWIEGEGHVQPGEKLEISKTDNGRAITVSGRGTWIYRLNDNEDLEFHGVNNNVKQEIMGWPLFFAKEENGNLNIFSGNNEISINESHEKLKEDEQTSEEFFRRFTISMSNYTSPGSFVNQSEYPQSSPSIDAWVYSDTEIENISFNYYLDPENRNDRIVLSIGTDGWIHLKKGWQVVNLSRGIMVWD